MDFPELSALLEDKEFTISGETCLVHDGNFSWLPDNSIDLILTDPPFNIARDTNFHTYEKNTINSYRFDGQKGWDSYTPEEFRSLLGDWAREFARALRDGGNFAVFCADEYLSDLINALKQAGLKPRRTLTWSKPNAVPVNRKYMMMSACEYIVVGVKGSKAVFNSDIETAELKLLTDLEIVAIASKAATILEQTIRKNLAENMGRPNTSQLEEMVEKAIVKSARLASKRSTNIYSEDSTVAQLCVPNHVSFNSKVGNRLHPTEKPTALLRYLIDLLSIPGSVLLDPFAGSSSLGEAALLSGRQVILVERDEEFYVSGAKRLRNIVEKMEAQLF
jgi:DNA modification methylase